MNALGLDAKDFAVGTKMFLEQIRKNTENEIKEIKERLIEKESLLSEIENILQNTDVKGKCENK